jgi:hypothetical protein
MTGGFEGGTSGTVHARFFGQRGGNAYRSCTVNCQTPHDNNCYLSGGGGLGGKYFADVGNFTFDFDETPASTLFNVVSNRPSGGGNFGGLTINVNPRTTNTGEGGGSPSVNCSGNAIGYGQGGDNGIVEVDVYV